MKGDLTRNTTRDETKFENGQPRKNAAWSLTRRLGLGGYRYLGQLVAHKDRGATICAEVHRAAVKYYLPTTSLKTLQKWFSSHSTPAHDVKPFYHVFIYWQ